MCFKFAFYDSTQIKSIIESFHTNWSDDIITYGFIIDLFVRYQIRAIIIKLVKYNHNYNVLS